jgi:hypothetical protein
LDDKLRTEYVTEKLSNAMSALTTGKGDVRSRLIVAYLCVHSLKPEDFPSIHSNEWLSIITVLTKKGPIKNVDGEVLVSSVENTMKRIQNRTGEKLAKRIEKLYWQISLNDRYQ